MFFIYLFMFIFKLNYFFYEGKNYASNLKLDLQFFLVPSH